MRGWLFYINTFGCKINQYETQKIREAWIARGGEETTNPACADYIVINSCAITARAERDARNAITHFKKACPGGKIILTGCAAQFLKDFTPRKGICFPQPDFCVPQHKKAEILINAPCIVPDTAGNNRQKVINYYRSRPVIKIQDGCSQNCSYCVVPQTRGKTTSRAPEEILSECRHYARLGAGEIVISGVNLRQYHSGGDFWTLLNLLNKELEKDYKGRLRLRLSSLDPAMLSERGLETLIACGMVCPHLHLSIQHASPSILNAMRRAHYRIDEIIDKVRALKSAWPLMALGADFIVGFPGESDADFDQLLNFCEQMPFTYAHVFPYSMRPNTEAQTMRPQITRKIKAKRSEFLRTLLEKKKKAFWQSLLNIPILTIAPEIANKDNKIQGMSEYYAPCFLKSQMQLGGLVKAQPIAMTASGILARVLDPEALNR